MRILLGVTLALPLLSGCLFKTDYSAYVPMPVLHLDGPSRAKMNQDYTVFVTSVTRYGERDGYRTLVEPSNEPDATGVLQMGLMIHRMTMRQAFDAPLSPSAPVGPYVVPYTFRFNRPGLWEVTAVNNTGDIPGLDFSAMKIPDNASLTVTVD